MAGPIRTYKVVAFIGEPDLKRKADSGILEIVSDRLLFHFGPVRDIRYADMKKVETEQLFKVGLTIRIQLAAESISLIVPLMNFAGYAVVVNTAATTELYDRIHLEWMRATKEHA